MYSDRIKVQYLSSKDPLLIFIAAYIHASGFTEKDGYDLIRFAKNDCSMLPVETTRFREFFNGLKQELVSNEEYITYCEDKENIEFNTEVNQIIELANDYASLHMSFD
jgi:hypothetical protein